MCLWDGLAVASRVSFLQTRAWRHLTTLDPHTEAYDQAYKAHKSACRNLRVHVTDGRGLPGGLLLLWR